MPSSMEKVKRWYGANGAPVDLRYYPEAASQTFKRGDLVYLVSGKVTGFANGNPTTEKVLGIAEADATGTTDTQLPVALANHNLRWVLPVTHGTPSSAITAVTHVGTKYELERIDVAKWAVPIDDTTNNFVVVTALLPQYPVAEQYGWVEVQFLDAVVDIRV